MINKQKIKEAYEWFYEYVESEQGTPFTSFSKGVLAENEGYKYELFVEAQEKLQIDEWKESDIGKGGISDRVISVIKLSKNNIIFPNNKSKFEKKIVADKKTADEILYGLYKSDNPKEFFDKACETWFKRFNELSYLMFVKDKEQYVPVLSSTFEEAFKILEIPTDYFEKCNWDNYQQYIQIMFEIKHYLEELFDMSISLLDTHSFIWVVAKERDKIDLSPRRAVSNRGKEKQIFYCRIGWMNNYNGSKEERPIGGGSYTSENIGHEVYNFADNNGSYYGYVQVKDTIHVEKLGAEGDKANNVLVVWVARNPSGGQYIVGWYKHANVYRNVVKVPKYILKQRELKDHDFYNVSTNDATLVDVDRRLFKIDGMGHTNFWYGDEETNKEVLDYINNFDSELEIKEIEKDIEPLEGAEKEAIVKQRVNQGAFRKQLLDKYNKCAICNVSYKRLLIASHIKPWSKSDKIEKLDVNNGLLLCANHDKLFDNGMISFDENGKIMISDRLDEDNKSAMSINEDMTIDITNYNKEYFKYHRDNIFDK